MLFEKEVKKLRSIPKMVKVRSAYSDTFWNIPRDSLLRDTNLLDRYELIENSKGELELWIDDPHWRNGLIEDHQSIKSIELLCLPHTLGCFPSRKFDSQKTLLNEINDALLDEFQPDSVVDALKSVQLLTFMTGLICTED